MGKKPDFNFKSFTKVLTRNSESEAWTANAFSHYDSERNPVCMTGRFKETIPYNEETRRLLGSVEPYELWVPADGDFVAFSWAEDAPVAIGIFCEFNSGDTMKCYACLHPTDKLADKGDADVCTCKYVRPATEAEKERMIQGLHRNGKEWDPEKKEIIAYLWPACGDSFWFVDSSGEVFEGEWYATNYQKEVLKAGNVFPSREFAAPYAEEFKKILQGH